MKVSIAILVATAAVTLLAASPSPAGAASSSCTAAHTSTEKAICATPQLGHLDERMARFYGWLWVVLDGGGRDALHEEQLLFLAFRDACGGDAVCLRTSYLTRIDDLARRLKRLTAEARLTTP